MVYVLAGKLFLIAKSLAIQIQILQAIWIGVYDRLCSLFQLCVISWKATLQLTIVLSTKEVEYVAVIEALKETIWFRDSVKNFNLHKKVTTLFCDS